MAPPLFLPRLDPGALLCHTEGMGQLAGHWGFHELLEFFIPRILAAIACGGLVGIERELKNKAAGLKTNILICLGAMLYTSLSVLIAHDPASGVREGDPGRIAAQIVSGIGFLGGGAIIQARGTVLGLTTAATIWVVAALGVCIGAGYGWVAIAVSLVSVLILTAANLFEDRILGRSLSFASEVLVDDREEQARMRVTDLLSRNDLVLNEFDQIPQNGACLLKLRYSGHRSDQKKFVLDLWGLNGVREVRQV